MREYRKTAKARERQRAFLRGFNALKDDLITAFRRIGEGEMSGFTALEIVKNSKPIVARETST